MKNFEIGDKVHYKKFDKVENGIVKSISDENHVFVVYHCDNDWKNYHNYTGCRTRIEDLNFGWYEFGFAEDWNSEEDKIWDEI